MNQLKVQNLYNTLLTQDGGIPPSGDCDFTVATAPTRTYGYIILSPDNALQREIMYYHNVVGNRIYVKGVNRISPREHAEGEVVKMNDVAEIFNTFSDMISQAFYVEKIGGLNVKVWGGYVLYNGNPVVVADTTLTLSDNTTNYIKYDFISNTIYVGVSDTGNVKSVITTSLGLINSISYRSHKESFQSLVPGAGDMLASFYDPSSKVKPVAFNDEIVHNTGNESISGVKTFSSSPIVPTPVSGTQASNKDYSDTLNPDFYQYSIVRTVASGNLIVALKNYLGNDPTPTAPVKIMIGGVVRTITSALGLSAGYGTTGTNWYNAGSTELATKEIDYFCYLRASSDNSIRLFHSRIPNATVMSDFSASGTYTNEKYGMDSGGIPAVTDPVVNIGRFNATLSAGAGYTWSIPATSVIVNSPIYETNTLEGVPGIVSWTNAPTSTTSLCRYKIQGDRMFIEGRITGTQNGSNSGTTVDLRMPFSSKRSYHSSCFSSAFWTDNATFDESASISFVGTSDNQIRLNFPTATRRPNELNFSCIFHI